MPSTPPDVARLHATVGELPSEADTQPTAGTGDGTETGPPQAAGEAVAPEAAGSPYSPVRVVPSGLWRPKAIAAALRAEGMGSLKEAQDITAFMLGFGGWRELARAATKGRADPPDEQCSAEEVRRRAYQAYVLASCSDMGPAAAAIAVDALQPTAKTGRPELDFITLGCMREASHEHAKAQLADELDGEDDDDWDDCGQPDADRTGREDADAVARVLAEAGLGSTADPLDVIDALQRTPSLPPSLWFPVLEKRFGWAVTPTDEDLGRNGE